jgi:hypothetical protein
MQQPVWCITTKWKHGSSLPGRRRSHESVSQEAVICESRIACGSEQFCILETVRLKS